MVHTAFSKNSENKKMNFKERPAVVQIWRKTDAEPKWGRED